MANAAILNVNVTAGAAVSTSSQELTMPALNLLDMHVQRRWRSKFSGDLVVLDLGSLTLMDTIGVFGMTMSVTGTIRVRISTADSSGVAGDLYDSGVVTVDNRYNAFIGLLPSVVLGRYIRFDLSDPASTYVEAGRVVAGVRSAFTYNFGYGWQKGYVDRSIRTETRGGQTLVWRDNAYRSLDLTFEFVTEDQRNGLVEDIDRLNGLRDDVLFIVDPSSPNLARDSIWGLMSDLTTVSNPFFQIYSKNYKIKERL